MYDSYDGFWYSSEDPPTLQPLIKHCPVCKQMFKLDPTSDLVAKCDDCRTDYYFIASQTLPYKNEVHSLKGKTCNCGRHG